MFNSLGTHFTSPSSLRRWRILTGLVMWIYMAAHMLNHSLGLISLRVAEAGIKLAILLIHSWPVSLLLYGAFGLHLCLAIIGIARRPSLRMPWLEYLRIALGLGFPLMLIGHVFATRLSHEWFNLAPEYGRVVASLIASGNEGRQLALLAPGWAHGCLGLYLSIQRIKSQPWMRPFFIGFCVALPVLAGAGFLAMEREVTQLLGDAHWRQSALTRLTPSDAAWFQGRRSLVIDLYLGAVLATFALRGAMIWWTNRTRQH